MNTKSRDFPAFWQSLAGILTSAPSTNIVFNQYRDRDDQLDLPDAAAIRTMNLRCYMAEATETASILVVGEAAGPWGCRFSGIPFTGERQLIDPSFPLHRERSSKSKPDGSALRGLSVFSGVQQGTNFRVTENEGRILEILIACARV